ncbi:MAG: hypothetical protein LLG06_12265 [Desulfobacteraceae bacterium]|nr:hypothetical protein [Desulfobacteraceae bacterium]
MTDGDTEKRKNSKGCFSNMREMMGNMISKKGGSCCSCGETMQEMMAGCCSPKAEEESKAEKRDRDAPK